MQPTPAARRTPAPKCTQRTRLRHGARSSDLTYGLVMHVALLSALLRGCHVRGPSSGCECDDLWCHASLGAGCRGWVCKKTQMLSTLFLADCHISSISRIFALQPQLERPEPAPNTHTITVSCHHGPRRSCASCGGFCHKCRSGQRVIFADL